MKNVFFLQRMYSKNDRRIKFYQKKIKKLRKKETKTFKKNTNYILKKNKMEIFASLNLQTKVSTS